jgi:HSP20 family protein
MDDVLARFSTGPNAGWLSEVQLPSTDVAETDKSIEVKMDVPGFKPEEINVEVQGNLLLISGEHKEEKEEKGKTFHRLERRAGSIRRTITLPTPVEQERVAAQCRDGVLTISLPKTEESRTKKIAVKA